MMIQLTAGGVELVERTCLKFLDGSENMRRALLVLLAIVISLFNEGCSSRKELNDIFDAYEVETAEKVPYVCYDTLVFHDVALDFDQLLDGNISDGVFHEVYAVRDDMIWFGYSDATRNENGAKTWYIASVAIDGRNFQIAYSGEFCSETEADQAYVKNNTSPAKERYFTANGFYYGGKIILTDHVKTVAYDLSTGNTMEFSAADYEYPTLPIEAEIIDHQTISFCKDTEQKIFDVETGIQTSAVFKELFELENKKNWQGKSYLSELFDKVQFVNHQVFILCRVMNRAGETHAVVFQYDFENNSCKYAFHCFMDDLIGNDLYVVPKI